MSAEPQHVRQLREFASAVDADRGHNKSYLTIIMREAADRLEELEEQIQAKEQERARSVAALRRIANGDFGLGTAACRYAQEILASGPNGTEP